MDYSQIITMEAGQAERQAVHSRTAHDRGGCARYLASGMTHAEILRDFPYLTEEDIRACLAFAADRERKSETLGGVKLLFDENLSPAVLVDALRDVYPESQHVSGGGVGRCRRRCRLGKYATQYGSRIVSKDSDFAERSVLESGPPKVIWIRWATVPTLGDEAQLRSAHEIVQAFIEEDEETCLLLGRG